MPDTEPKVIKADQRAVISIADWEASHRADGTLAPAAVEAASLGGYDRPAPAAQTVVDTFAAGHTWIGWGPTPGTDFNDTSDGVLSGQHISMSPPSGSTTVEAIRRDGLALDLTANLLRLYVRLENATAIGAIRVFCLTTPPSGDYYRKDYVPDASGDSPILGDGWQVLTIDPLDGDVRGTTGTPNMASVAGLRIDIASTGEGETGTLHLGGIVTVPRSRAAFPNGVVSITFDDNTDDCWTDLRPILAAYDHRATLYVIQDTLGTSGKLTLDQLTRLHDLHGWEVAHHATTAAVHTATYPSLSTAALEREFETAQAWYREHGFGRAASVSYPEGQYSATIAETASRYFRSGRGTDAAAFGQDIAIAPGLGPYRLKSRSLQAGAAVEDWPSAYVDPTYDNGGWFIMHGHLIGAADGSGQVSASKLDDLMSYIAGKGMPVLPVAEVMSRLATAG